jgi:iron complex outermembrane receptor protein
VPASGAVEGDDRELSGLAAMPIEELMGVEVSTVLGASRYEQRISDAPASISIITSQDIKRYGYRTMADVLNSVPGLYITYDRNYGYLGAGGFLRQGDYNTRMLLLVDGHRMNNNIYDTAAVGNDLILDLDLVDRVEVIRGPGSSLYGSNAFFGVINVITKGAGHVNGLELSAEAGSFDANKQRATFGRTFGNGLEMVLSATRYNSRGQSQYYKEYDSPATNSGWSDGNDYEGYSSFFTNFKLAGLDVQAAYGSRTKGIPTGAWGTVFNDDRTKSTDAQGYIDVRYHRAFRDNQDLSVRVFYDYYRYDGKYLFDYPPLSINRDLAVGKWWGTEAFYKTRIGNRHTVIAGLEYRDNLVQQQKNYDDSPYAVYLDDNRGSYSAGAYAQGEFVVTDRVLVNLGARYDHYKDFSGRLNPRAALIWNPMEKTTVKLIYGEAYRIPNAYELYYTDGDVTQRANPGLDPETIRTYELVLEKYVKDFRLCLSGFYYDVENLISQQNDASGLMVFANAGRAEGKGIQFEMERKWAGGFSGKFSYSFQEVTSNQDGVEFANFPKHLVKFNAFGPIIRNWLGAGLEIRYASSQKNLNGTRDGGYTLVNATLLSEKIFRDLDLSFSVYNVLDKKYSNPGSHEHVQSDIEQDGRTFRLKATYRF